MTLQVWLSEHAEGVTLQDPCPEASGATESPEEAGKVYRVHPARFGGSQSRTTFVAVHSSTR